MLSTLRSARQPLVAPRKAEVSSIGASSPTRSACASSRATASDKGRGRPTVPALLISVALSKASASSPCSQAASRAAAGDRIGQVQLPLLQLGTGLAGEGGELLVALARDAQQAPAGLQQLLGHGAAQAAGSAGDDGEMG